MKPLHFRPTLRAELGSAFNLGAAFRAELLALDRLTTLSAELRTRRDTSSAIGATADDRFFELFLRHIRRLLSRHSRLLYRRLRLRRRVLRFQIGCAL